MIHIEEKTSDGLILAKNGFLGKVDSFESAQVLDVRPSNPVRKEKLTMK